MKAELPRVESEYIKFAGGLDLVSPVNEKTPGSLLAGVNYEPEINGGYRLMKGMERSDGRTRPSDATYSLMHVTLTGAVVAGDVVTGDTSGATATVLKVNGTTELVVSKVSATAFVAETIKVGGVPVGTVATTATSAATTPLLHVTYLGLAAALYRADILKVPGSGAVLGFHYYNNARYAFRNNVAGTAAVMYKATTAGWVEVALGLEVQFTNGNTAVPVDGETLTQGGVTATVRRVLTRTGAWSGTAVGTFVISAPAGGDFAAGAASLSGGASVSLVGIQTAITLLPGGRFKFFDYNFAGGAATYRMYFVDGVNKCHEFDGTYMVPIRTGMPTDAPKFIACHKNALILSFTTSVQVSGVADPYSFTVLTGATELAVGATITGLLPQVGSETMGALAIFTARSTYILYGNDSSDFALVLHSSESGAASYTDQNIGFAYYLDIDGVVQITSTRNYGNFQMATLTRKVQPFIDLHRNMAVASCVVKSSNQYRVFYSDGTGLIIHMNGPEVAAIMQFDYGTRTFNVVESYIDASGVERIYAGGTDGYVYELDVGTSMDGDNWFAYLLPAFYSSRSPNLRKRYRRGFLQATCADYTELYVGYNLDYGSNEHQSGVNQAHEIVGGGGWWNQFTWNVATWSAPYATDYKITMTGVGRNVGLLIYSNSAINSQHTIQGFVMNYSTGRIER